VGLRRPTPWFFVREAYVRRAYASRQLTMREAIALMRYLEDVGWTR
jgi:hypothetical protein